ncbi:MAG: glycerate kinase type-2 family protein [Candidatus Binataceae bacterium]
MLSADYEATARAELQRFYRAAVAAVDPARLIYRALDGAIAQAAVLPAEIAAARRVIVLAIGKGASAMAAALETRLDDRIADGIAVIPAPSEAPVLKRFDLLRGEHPIPGRASEHSAHAALGLVRGLRDDDLVIVALSGGASAMLSAPAPGLLLEDKIAVTAALLRSGAPIREFNLVRKHLSAVKGGHLAAAAMPARVFGLILSDVPGNDLATIGSGLTAPDPTTFADAVSVLKRRGVWGRAPERVREHLERGVSGEISETPKPGDAVFARVTNAIIGDNTAALDAAAKAAASAGYAVEGFPELRGEAEEVGRALADRIAALPKGRICAIAGGEPVVTVRGGGRGGRAQHCALAIAAELAQVAPQRKISALVAGTDGIDGPTDAAGGFASPATVARAAARGLDAATALARNDAYNLLEASGDLFRTGPTGTNAADIFLAIVDEIT